LRAFDSVVRFVRECCAEVEMLLQLLLLLLPLRLRWLLP
jgi:hypothetical protein